MTGARKAIRRGSGSCCSSPGSTGGYCIGLSTVWTVAARHKSRISNHYADRITTFTTMIPQVS